MPIINCSLLRSPRSGTLRGQLLFEGLHTENIAPRLVTSAVLAEIRAVLEHTTRMPNSPTKNTSPLGYAGQDMGGYKP